MRASDAYELTIQQASKGGRWIRLLRMVAIAIVSMGDGTESGGRTARIVDRASGEVKASIRQGFNDQGTIPALERDLEELSVTAFWERWIA